MAALSTLRVALTGVANLTKPLYRGSSGLRPRVHAISVIRSMGGGHANKMVIKPSTYEYTLWKDHVHLYLAISLIPMAILITYVNVFIGRAELADIPEDYEPQHWEYYQHPIQRWFARYVYDNPQKTYEKTLHVINYEQQKRTLRLLESKVKDLMAQRGDYKGWYYVPVNARKVYLAREIDQRRKLESGGD